MSVQQTVVRAGIVLSGRGRVWRSAASLDRAVATRSPDAPPPPSGHGVVVSARAGEPEVVRLVPRAASGAVLALHGGGYVFGAAAQHWTLWRRIAVASGRTVVAPLYPLAPGGTAGAVVPRIAQLAAELAAEGPLALLGDSAGAGMALAVALLLREQGLRPTLLLSSPWLDGTLREPWTVERDPWLAAPGLRRAADLYRGDLPVEHPFVSPLLHDLGGLGPITAASGTCDVLHRDALRLAEQVPDPVRLLIGRGLLHDYPLLPIPEARPAVRAFVDALR